MNIRVEELWLDCIVCLDFGEVGESQTGGGLGGRGGMIVNVGTIMVNSKEYSGLYIMNAGCVPAAISVSSLFLL